MSNYFSNLNEEIKEYFNILSDEIPDFLYDYIETPEMQKQDGISLSCGTCYTKLCNTRVYTSLQHSIAVALIVWHFTKDRKQTLSGLFHDIATPVFKHAVDFMNGDYKNQESTEELTTEIISKSKEIMSLLNRDGIKIEEVCDYHIYPIADNDTPQLSSDRLEYTFSNAIGKGLLNLQEIKEIYNSIEIQRNEEGIEEMGFRDIALAEKFVKTMSILSSSYITNEIKLSMQFLADIMKKLVSKNIVTKSDLYKLSEKEIIEKIENCKEENISECFKLWRNATHINESDVPVKDKYCVSVEGKMRYINPLVKSGDEYIRINKISNTAKENIERALNFKTKKYAYLDFNF